MLQNLKYIVIFIGFTTTAFAQKGWEVGGWLGTSFYNGDLNPTLNLRDPGLAGGLFTKYNLNTRVAIRGGVSYAQLAGDDAKSSNNFAQARNLNFSSNVFDFSAGIEFNFFNYIHSSEFDTYTPYVFAGVNMFTFNPKTEFQGNTVALQPLGTEGQDIGDEYGRISGGIVLGGGFKWEISKDITFAVEITTRRTMTDYLDDVSTTYPDMIRLEAIRGPQAVALSDRSINGDISGEGLQRGNQENNDTFTFIGVSISKYFGRLECPPISKIY